MKEITLYHYRKKFHNLLELEYACDEARANTCECKRCYTFYFTKKEYKKLYNKLNQ